MLLYI